MNSQEARQTLEQEKNKLSTYEKEVKDIDIPRRNLKFQQDYIKSGKIPLNRSQQIIQGRKSFKEEATKNIANVKSQLSSYEQEINSVEAEQKAINEDIQARQQAYKMWQDRVPYGFVRGQPEYKYLKELWEKNGSFSKQIRDEQEYYKQQKQLKELNLTPVYRDNKLVGYEDSKTKMSYPVENLPNVITKYRPEDMPKFEKAGFVERLPVKQQDSLLPSPTIAEAMAGQSLLPEYRYSGKPGQFREREEKKDIVENVLGKWSKLGEDASSDLKTKFYGSKGIKKYAYGVWGGTALIGSKLFFESPKQIYQLGKTIYKHPIKSAAVAGTTIFKAVKTPRQTFTSIKSSVSKSAKQDPLNFGAEVGAIALSFPKSTTKLAKLGRKSTGLVDESFITADVGELVPLRDRLRQVEDILYNKKGEVVTITARRKLWGNKLTNKKIGDIDYTYGKPIAFGTVKVGDTMPTSELFLKGKWWKGEIIGRAEVETAKLQNIPKAFKQELYSDLKKYGKTSESNIKRLYSMAQKEADITGKPIATLSPKRLRGFNQPELEVVKIYPKNYKRKMKFAGFTPEGHLIMKDKPFIKNINERFARTGDVHKLDYFETIAKEKARYLKGEPVILGEYAEHGAKHLLPMEKYGRYYSWHDLVKSADVDSFSQYPHGETMRKLWKKGRLPDEFYNMPKKEQRLLANAYAGHEYARFNIKSLFLKPTSKGRKLTLPSRKQLAWYIKNKIRPNPKLEDISTLDRLDLARFGAKPDPLYLSKPALKRMFGNKANEVIAKVTIQASKVKVDNKKLTNVLQQKYGYRNNNPTKNIPLTNIKYEERKPYYKKPIYKKSIIKKSYYKSSYPKKYKIIYKGRGDYNKGYKYKPKTIYVPKKPYQPRSYNFRYNNPRSTIKYPRHNYPPYKSSLGRVTTIPKVKIRLGEKKKSNKGKWVRKTIYTPSFTANVLSIKGSKKPLASGKSTYLPTIRPIIVRKSKKRRYK